MNPLMPTILQHIFPNPKKGDPNLGSPLKVLLAYHLRGRKRKFPHAQDFIQAADCHVATIGAERDRAQRLRARFDLRVAATLQNVPKPDAAISRNRTQQNSIGVPCDALNRLFVTEKRLDQRQIAKPEDANRKIDRGDCEVLVIRAERQRRNRGPNRLERMQFTTADARPEFDGGVGRPRRHKPSIAGPRDCRHALAMASTCEYRVATLGPANLQRMVHRAHRDALAFGRNTDAADPFERAVAPGIDAITIQHPHANDALAGASGDQSVLVKSFDRADDAAFELQSSGHRKVDRIPLDHLVIECARNQLVGIFGKTEAIDRRSVIL